MIEVLETVQESGDQPLPELSLLKVQGYIQFKLPSS